MISPKALQERIEACIPEARACVRAFHGSDHFEAVVIAAAFEGKSLLEQHRMVYDCLGGLLGSDIHALRLKTRTPKQWEEENERNQNDAGEL